MHLMLWFGSNIMAYHEFNTNVIATLKCDAVERAVQQAPATHYGQYHSAASYPLCVSPACCTMQNPLVWSTAVAVLLSALGSAALLDPSSPLALKHLAFLEALLGWFAQTTAPLTLFTTGLWMHSNSQQQQQQRQHQGHANTNSATSSSSSERKPVQSLSYGSQEVAWSEVFVHLLLRATVAPALMVVVCRLMGFTGDLAHALVILALLPVAQTAFVVCKQAETGMAAVSVMLVASLFMMLPQLMVVLAVLERLGVLAGEA
jgi:predicted permease